MRETRFVLLGASLLLCAQLVLAEEGAEKTVEMHAVNKEGVQESIGEIVIREEADGLTFEPNLEGLEPGVHGFHIHQYADCGSTGPDGKRGAGLAAGSHLDPEQSGQHGKPWSDDGHLGDLPALYASKEKRITQAVHLHDLSLDDVQGHALMIHAGGDNYADMPEPNGGGGDRVACGAFKE